MTHPIPDTALDDRLGFVGTSGSGKTYGAGTAVERLLDSGARCIICDPLDVWFGLRSLPDGKTASRYNVAILGGKHGDLPLTEHAGALIGETVATSAESFIVSLASLGTKAAERRFMLAFLAALYRHANGEPVHLVFDEADMWAPQKLLDKEGEAAKLLGQMETIVRRGRVKGFIPWLITQRPAVLSKDVLSQVDGLIAFKLTSSQDRDAIGAWIEGQADKKEGQAILAALPAMDQGRAVVWVPTRGVLTTSDFPRKRTFDSSATPKRGETKRSATLKPLNVEVLKGRLETVAKEVEQNDPKRLQAEISRLNAQVKRLNDGKADPAAMQEAERRGYVRGRFEALQSMGALARASAQHLEAAADNLRTIERTCDDVKAAGSTPNRDATLAEFRHHVTRKPPIRAGRTMLDEATRTGEALAAIARTVGGPSATFTACNPGEPMKDMPRKILTALAQHPAGLSKGQILVHTGYRSSGPVSACFAELARDGWINTSGLVTITHAGLAALGSYEPLPVGDELRESLLNGNSRLSPMEKKLLRAVCEAYPDSIGKGRVLEQTTYASSGPVSAAFAHLVALGYCAKDGRGALKAAQELFG